jgi:hypothetical protein
MQECHALMDGQMDRVKLYYQNSLSSAAAAAAVSCFLAKVNNYELATKSN